MLIFGTTFSHLHVIDTGNISYPAFLLPGIIAQSALFISIFYGERVMLGAAFFACLSMTLAGLVRSRHRMMGIGQAMTMPSFFASNALHPVDVTPGWMRALSKVNVLRALLIGTPFHIADIIVLVVAPVIGIITPSNVYAPPGRLVLQP